MSFVFKFSCWLHFITLAIGTQKSHQLALTTGRVSRHMGQFYAFAGSSSKTSLSKLTNLPLHFYFGRNLGITSRKQVISSLGIRSTSRENHSFIPKHYQFGTRLFSVATTASAGGMEIDPSTSRYKPLIICGPSGVGKGTIISKYLEERSGSDHFSFTVSHTTRAPRSGEVDGVHYHFTSSQQMRLAIEKGSFIEYAEVHGNIYGTSFEAMKDVEREGKNCLLDIDVQGVQSIKKNHPNLSANYIFVSPPSMEVLQKRLQDRGTETKESLEKRTANAAAEMAYGMENGNFDAILVNNDLDVACEDLTNILNKLYNNFRNDT